MPVAVLEAPPSLGPASTSRAEVRERSALRVVVRGAAALASTQPLTWAASLFSAAFIPHFLGAGQVGELTLALTVSGFAVSIAGMGINACLPRRIAARPERAETEATSALVLVLCLAIAFAVILAILVEWTRLQGLEPNIVRLALIGMVITAGQGVLFGTLNGQQRFARFAWLNALGVVIATLLGFVVLALGGGIAGLLISSSATFGGVLLWSWWISGIRLTFTTGFASVCRDQIRMGLPFLGWDLALRIYGEANKFILAAYSPIAVVGWYAAANRIVSIPVFIPTLITTPLLPVLTRAAGDPRLFEHILRRSLIAVALLTMPVSAGILALAPEIPRILHWDAEFGNAVPLMMVLALQQPLVGVDMVLGTALLAASREKAWFRVAVLAVFINPLLNVLLIPYTESGLHNGGLGAGVVAILTDLLMLGGALRLLPRGTVDRATAFTLARVCAAGGCVIAVAWPLGSASWVLGLVGGAAAYILATWMLRIVAVSDLRGLQTFLIPPGRQQ